MHAIQLHSRFPAAASAWHAYRYFGEYMPHQADAKSRTHNNKRADVLRKGVMEERNRIWSWTKEFNSL